MKTIDLFESKVNSHIDHIEELILSDGKSGIIKSIKILHNVYGLLTNADPDSAFISQKFDGISIVFGIDPSDNRFFVGTKSAFSLTPKIIKSEKDLQAHYEDRADLADKLRSCLHNLRSLNVTGIFQGDLLFTSDTLEPAVIDGQKMITFCPNTITYAVPECSEVGKAILQSSLGIAVHTSYRGNIGELEKDERPKLGQLSSNKRVWVKPVTYDDYSSIQLSDAEKKSITNDFELILGLVKNIKGNQIDKVLNYSNIRKDMKSWIIQSVNNGEQIETVSSLKSFFNYVIRSNNTLIKAYKTDKAKENKVTKLDELKSFLITNRSAFESIVRIHNMIVKIKNRLLSRLNTIEEIGAFVKTDDGYKVTNPEGFVAIGGAGDVVKLIDRLEFSRINTDIGAPWKRK